MNGQKNLRSFHNFLDFPVPWMWEATKLTNDKYQEGETKPRGDAENEKWSERPKRKLGKAHRRVGCSSYGRKMSDLKIWNAIQGCDSIS